MNDTLELSGSILMDVVGCVGNNPLLVDHYQPAIGVVDTRQQKGDVAAEFASRLVRLVSYDTTIAVAEYSRSAILRLVSLPGGVEVFVLWAVAQTYEAAVAVVLFNTEASIEKTVETRSRIPRSLRIGSR